MDGVDRYSITISRSMYGRILELVVGNRVCIMLEPRTG